MSFHKKETEKIELVARPGMLSSTSPWRSEHLDTLSSAKQIVQPIIITRPQSGRGNIG